MCYPVIVDNLKDSRYFTEETASYTQESVTRIPVGLVGDMISIKKYEAPQREEWNRLVRESSNGLFLFNRDYMDYHADRFVDHSIMFLEDGQPIALFPANIDDARALVSHGGLTFGGLIRTPKLRARNILDLFGCLIDTFETQSFAGILYKAIPLAFQTQPSEDDLYALHRFGFKLMRRDLSSVVPLDQPTKYSKGRKWSIGKAAKNNVSVRSDGQLAPFYNMLERRLQTRYAVRPTHSQEELGLLASRFPDNIRISCAYLDDFTEPCAGVTLYDCGCTLHTQYMATTEEGRDVGALDFLIDYHIDEARRLGKRFFSFGISTENEGMVLNEGLVQQKESFGALGVIHDFYKLER